jgi:hypothetical protein
MVYLDATRCLALGGHGKHHGSTSTHREASRSAKCQSCHSGIEIISNYDASERDLSLVYTSTVSPPIEPIQNTA